MLIGRPTYSILHEAKWSDFRNSRAEVKTETRPSRNPFREIHGNKEQQPTGVPMGVCSEEAMVVKRWFAACGMVSHGSVRESRAGGAIADGL